MVNGGLKAPGVRRFCFWILSRASPEFSGYIAMKTVVPRLNVGVEYAAHEEVGPGIRDTAEKRQGIEDCYLGMGQYL